MYQPWAQICKSPKRYVVVTYHSTICTSYEKHVYYTCISGKMFQIGTEQVRNKRIFIYFPYSKFILILGANFIFISTNY